MGVVALRRRPNVNADARNVHQANICNDRASSSNRVCARLSDLLSVIADVITELLSRSAHASHIQPLRVRMLLRV